MKPIHAETTPIDVEYVARLAQLALTGEEKEKMGKEMAAFLAFASALDQVELPEKGQSLPKMDGNAQRGDMVTPSLGRDLLLENAPQVKEGQVVVPGGQGSPSDVQWEKTPAPFRGASKEEG